MKYARLFSDNSVIETFTPPDGVSINDCFVPEIVSQFVEVPDEVKPTWVKQDDGTFAAPTLIDEPEPTST